MYSKDKQKDKNVQFVEERNMNEYEFAERMHEEKAEVIVKEGLTIKGQPKTLTGKRRNSPADNNLPRGSASHYITLN